MENAAKALLIAGGILIAIMTLSLVVYATTATKRIEQAQYEKLEAEKLAKFNMEYEAYNKRRLYGLDVISVINKAIEHNKKMDASSIDNKYYINIVFKITTDFKNELYKIDNNNPDSGETLIQVDELPAEAKFNSLRTQANKARTIDAGTNDGRYELGTFQANNENNENNENFVMNNNFLIKFERKHGRFRRI